MACFARCTQTEGAHTPEAGGKVDKANPMPFGRAMAQLGIEMIPAYSPEARGRSERAFRNHQDRLVRELEVAGITDRAAANRYRQETYLPAYNAEFTPSPREPGSAFIACRDRGILDDVLYEQFERTVRKDNGVPFEGLTLPIPADRHGGHDIKRKVKVLRHTDGTLSVHHSPRMLARYSDQGQALTEKTYRLPRNVRRSTDRWPARSERLQQLNQKRTIYVIPNRTSLFVANRTALYRCLNHCITT